MISISSPETMANELATPSRFDLSAIDRASLADSTKDKYRREIEKYLATGGKLGDLEAIRDYAGNLSQSSRAFFKGALRLMSAEYADMLKAGATPENVGAVQAGLYRLEALQDAIKVRKNAGTKAHTWLSQTQVRDITKLCGDDLEGKRDWIILGLLLGAGLRREELANLTFDALKSQPSKGKMRDVLEVKGKGAKSRVIPIKSLLADRLREWREITGGGLVARSLGRNKQLSDSMSAVAIFHVVRKYGERIGLPDLAPHDLRRTYAQLGFEAGVPITQVSKLLGHARLQSCQCS